MRRSFILSWFCAVVGILLAALLLAGSSRAEDATPEPWIEPSPTSTLAPTFTPTFTPTSEPSATPTTEPTNTPSSAPTPSPTARSAAPQATATPVTVRIGADSYTAFGNTQMLVAEPASAPASLGKVSRATNPLANDSSTLGRAVSVTSTTVTGDKGGTATFSANGKFVYQPKTNFVGTEKLTYRVTDGRTSANGTITITVQKKIWYVRNDAATGGDGSSTKPFITLAAAVSASGANHYIYVHAGDGTSTGMSNGITLKQGQKLIGSASDLKIGTTMVAPGTPDSYDAYPRITNASGPALRIYATSAKRTGVYVAGLEFDGTGASIDIKSASTFGFGVTLKNLRIEGAGACIRGAHGGSSTANLTITMVWCDVGGNGLDISATKAGLSIALTSIQVGDWVSHLYGDPDVGVRIAGSPAAGGAPRVTIAITKFTDFSIGITESDGVRVSDAVFNTTIANAAFGIWLHSDHVSAGGKGLALSEVQGTLYLGESVFTGVAGNTIASPVDPTLPRLTVNSNGANWRLNGTAGPALDWRGGTAALTATFFSTGSSTHALYLQDVGGSINASSLSRLEESTDATVRILRGGVNLTYGGTITDDTGELIRIEQSTGDITFSGLVDDGNDGDGSGILISGHTGTMTFSGGLLINATTRGFSMSNGGKIAITGLGNQITTTNATAIVIDGTRITASGITLRSINTSGGSAMTLKNTGAQGRLTVTGTGAPGSGGTINGQNGSTYDQYGAFLSAGLTGTIQLGPVLNDMTFKNFEWEGIYAHQVDGLSLNRVKIENIDPLDVSSSGYAIEIQKALGSYTLTDCTFSNIRRSAIEVTNPLAGAALTLIVDGTTFTGTSTRGTAGIKAQFSTSASSTRTVPFTLNVLDSDFSTLVNGIIVTGKGSAPLGITVNDSTFTSLRGVAMLTSFEESTNGNLVAERNVFTTISGSGITVAASASADTNIQILLNTFTTITGSAVSISASGSGASMIDVEENTITGTTSFGVSIAHSGSGAATAEVEINTLTTLGNHAINLTENSSSTLKATVSGNTIGSGVAGTGTSAGSGIYLGTSGSGTSIASMSGNIIAFPKSRGIYVYTGTSSTSAASVNVTISTNVVGTTAVGSSGEDLYGIYLFNDGAAKVAAKINGNTIRHSQVSGIRLSHAATATSISVIISNNTVLDLENTSSNSAPAGIRVDTGNGTAAYTVCIAISGNSSSAASPYTKTIRVTKGTNASAVVKVQSYTPDGTGSGSSVATRLTTTNPGNTVEVTGSGYGTGTCTTPTLP